jgi:hypothetical protein
MGAMFMVETAGKVVNLRNPAEQTMIRWALLT